MGVDAKTKQRNYRLRKQQREIESRLLASATLANPSLSKPMPVRDHDHQVPDGGVGGVYGNGGVDHGIRTKAITTKCLWCGADIKPTFNWTRSFCPCTDHRKLYRRKDQLDKVRPMIGEKLEVCGGLDEKPLPPTTGKTVREVWIEIDQIG